MGIEHWAASCPGRYQPESMLAGRRHTPQFTRFSLYLVLRAALHKQGTEQKQECCQEKSVSSQCGEWPSLVLLGSSHTLDEETWGAGQGRLVPQCHVVGPRPRRAHCRDEADGSR